MPAVHDLCSSSMSRDTTLTPVTDAHLEQAALLFDAVSAHLDKVDPPAGRRLKDSVMQPLIRGVRAHIDGAHWVGLVSLVFTLTKITASSADKCGAVALGVHALATDILRQNQDSMHITMAGVGLLSAVSVDAPKSVQLALCESGAVGLCATVLRTHRETPALVSVALQVLCHIGGKAPVVAAMLMQRESLTTLVAAMNCHMDSDDVPIPIMSILQYLLRKPEYYPRLKEFSIPDCVQRYGEKNPGNKLGNMLAALLQKKSAVNAVEGDGPSGVVSDETLHDTACELLITRHMSLSSHAARSGILGEDSLSLPAGTATVLYLPEVSQSSLNGFCSTLRAVGLTVSNVHGFKSPSALKRDLALCPMVVVCTHLCGRAKPGSKAHKLHMCVWRELVRHGVSVRALVYLQEAEMANDAVAASFLSMYTSLAECVKSNYVQKLSQETQTALWEQGSLLYCQFKNDVSFRSHTREHSQLPA
ncbi:hypothetical protein KIPB_003658 [Kipferlia bialata]|uniref:Uncharacterized protein n=1 Tax=Kipferlia bialata TaxID=797122 RepID=A0A9K3CVS3_9EUKA|nr:hypothetical protein KIPB_003658 [Kipferlia bialata]|eukprot:g3658.t1